MRVKLALFASLLFFIASHTKAQKGCRDLNFVYTDTNRTFFWRIGCFDGTTKHYEKNKLKIRQQRNVNLLFTEINPYHFSVDDKSEAVSFSIPNSDGNQLSELIKSLEQHLKTDSVDAKTETEKNTDAIKKAAGETKSNLDKANKKNTPTNSVQGFVQAIDPGQETVPNMSAAVEIIEKELIRAWLNWDGLKREYQQTATSYSDHAKRLASLNDLESRLQYLKYSELAVSAIQTMAKEVVKDFLGGAPATPSPEGVTGFVAATLAEAGKLEVKGVQQATALREAEVKLQVLLASSVLILRGERGSESQPLVETLETIRGRLNDDRAAADKVQAALNETVARVKAGEWLKKAQAINEIWLSIRVISNQLVITRVAEGDKLDLKFRIYRKNWLNGKVTIVDSTQAFQFCVRVKQGIKVTTSTGIGISHAIKQPYNYLVKDSVIVQERTTRTTPLLTTMVHAQWRAAVDVAFGLSMGLGVPLTGDKYVHVLFAPSLILGTSERLIISAGVAATPTKTLGGGYALGEKVRGLTVVPTQSETGLGLFAALTYNLKLNTNVKT